MKERPWLRQIAVPLASSYDVALLDLDGVVYLGPRPVDAAADAIAAARDAGMRMAFVTNNASRTPETVAGHLTGLGVTASADEVITSSMAAARLLSTLVPPGSAVLVVGGEGLRTALSDAGFSLVGDGDAADAVAQGYTLATTWAELAEASIAVARGVPWVASNLDSTMPTPRGLVPGNGALVDVVARTTGRIPLAAGKPETPLHDEAVRRTGASRPLVVGDRLDTDIEGAVRAQADSLLVLTGVTDARTLLGAGPRRRPTYIARDLRGLLRPHPGVRVAPDGSATCGAWQAVVDDDVRLRLEPAEGAAGAGSDDDRLDGLRAIAAASWAAADEGAPAATLDLVGDEDVLRTLGLEVR